jgi:hypothetical protein
MQLKPQEKQKKNERGWEEKKRERRRVHSLLNSKREAFRREKR